MSAEIISEREYLYRLIIGQLIYDGLNEVADHLSHVVGIDPNRVPPGPQLISALRTSRYNSSSLKKKCTNSEHDIRQHFDSSKRRSQGLDFEEEYNGSSAPLLSEYIGQYVATHKGPVTCAAFSTDGRTLATGSQDRSIKIYETEKITFRLTDSKTTRGLDSNIEESLNKNHPVIKTLYDHLDAITCIDFHPTADIIASGGFDKHIYLNDITKSTMRRAYKSISETDVISCLNFHPSGDYILVAVPHPTIRLYDLNTLSCYATSQPECSHLGLVNSIKYESSGKMYVTGSTDGSIKMWDGVSNRCFNTIYKAHNNFPICSTEFSNNGKYVLSSALDGLALLWDIRTFNVLQQYTGIHVNDQGRFPAIFNHSNDFVISLDDKSSYGCWNTRTGDKLCSLNVPSNSWIRSVAHSSNEPLIVSCCDDTKVRIFYFGD